MKNNVSSGVSWDDEPELVLFHITVLAAHQEVEPGMFQ